MLHQIRDITTSVLPPDFLTSSMTTPAKEAGIDQIHFTYRAGNEYIPVSTLTDALGKFGKVFVEYRGRGRNETPRLVFEVDGAQPVQVFFHFADN